MRHLKIVGMCLLLTACSTMNMSTTHKEQPQNKHLTLEKIIAESSQKTAAVAKQPAPSTPRVIVKYKKNPKGFDHKHELHLEYSDKLYNFWVKYYTGKKSNRDRFIRHMKNGERYRELVEEVFRSHGLPEDLFFVGLIESGFNLHIKSHASAKGPWQFIKGTAKRYNLRVDGSLDERSNIVKATEAAANYFKDLYHIFGSWELALCAYNAGEYRIINAIRRGKTRDYKELVRKKLIPKETIYYVPKVAAAREIFNNKKKYSFPKIISDDRAWNNVAMAEIRGSYKISDLRRHLGLSYKSFKKYNPDTKRNTIYSRRGKVRVVVPVGLERKVTSFKQRGKLYTAPAEPSQFHYVKSGENLTLLARKYGTSVKAIKNANMLSKSYIYKGQKLIIPASNYSSKKKARVAKKRATKSKKHQFYKVQKGDSLYKIAKTFKTTTKKIQRMNRLSSTNIYKGQNLRVPASHVQLKKYRVRRGDNLFKIAKKFNTTVRSITAMNSIKNHKIYKGQTLIIPRG